MAQPSCSGLQPTCGPSGNESCCASSVVAGGIYHRSNDAAYPAMVRDFRLDRFEITVGRFRQFMASYPMNKPAAGAGAHPLIDELHELVRGVCVLRVGRWAVGGGRLATEAEWNYAAAGGNEQRQYPWGAAAPDTAHAVYDCTGDGPASGQCAATDILNVGAKSTVGDGKWGQADLAGGVAEWTLDWYGDPYSMQRLRHCVPGHSLVPGVPGRELEQRRVAPALLRSPLRRPDRPQQRRRGPVREDTVKARHDDCGHVLSLDS